MGQDGKARSLGRPERGHTRERTPALLLPREQTGGGGTVSLERLSPPEPSHSTPESALVPGHSGECVAIDGVEVVMVWHIVGEDLSVNHVALALLTCFVHGLWVGNHQGSKLTRSWVGSRLSQCPCPGLPDGKCDITGVGSV